MGLIRIMNRQRLLSKGNLGLKNRIEFTISRRRLSIVVPSGVVSMLLTLKKTCRRISCKFPLRMLLLITHLDVHPHLPLLLHRKFLNLWRLQCG